MRYHQISPFKKHLRSSYPDHLLPNYLVQGKSDEGRQEAIEIFIELFQKDASPFAIKNFDGKEIDFEDFLGELNTFNAFADSRLIVLKDAQALSKSYLETLKKYLQSPNKSVCLLIEATSLSKDMLALVEKQGAVLDLLPEKSWEKEKRIGQWIDQVVKKNRMQMDADAKECLLRWVGANKNTLSSELEKLITYAAGRGKIHKDDVTAICTFNSQETIWKLYDAVLAKDAMKSLYVLRSLIHENVAPQMLLAQLRGHFQMLLKILHATTEEGMRQLLKQYFYLKGKLLERHKAAARSFGELQIKHALVEIYNVDLKMREGLEDSQALLEMLLTNLTLKTALV